MVKRAQIKLTCKIKNRINLSVISPNLKFYLIFQIKHTKEKKPFFFCLLAFFFNFSNFFLALLSQKFLGLVIVSPACMLCLDSIASKKDVDHLKREIIN